MLAWKLQGTSAHGADHGFLRRHSHASIKQNFSIIKIADNFQLLTHFSTGMFYIWFEEHANKNFRYGIC